MTFKSRSRRAGRTRPAIPAPQKWPETMEELNALSEPKIPLASEQPGALTVTKPAQAQQKPVAPAFADPAILEAQKIQKARDAILSSPYLTVKDNVLAVTKPTPLPAVRNQNVPTFSPVPVPNRQVQLNQRTAAPNTLKPTPYASTQIPQTARIGGAADPAIPEAQKTYDRMITGMIDPAIVDAQKTLEKKNDPYLSDWYGTSNETASQGKGFEYNWTGEHVTDEFKSKVLDMCEKLQMNPDDLMSIMAFESGGINPDIKNSSSGATGLIQFMPSTAKSLGTTTDELAQMSAVEQLDYVYEYFKPYASKIHNIEDAYMAVFMPIAIGKDNDFVIGIKDSKDYLEKGLTYGAVYKYNSGLDSDKDGKITKEEAAQSVIRKRDSYK